MNFYGFLKTLSDAHGNARKDLHNPIKEQPALIQDQDPMGMMGEMYLALLLGHSVDLEQKIEGDGGYDFVVPLKFTIDVKTTAKTPRSNNLLVEQGKVKADIYVAAMHENGMVDLIGWAMKSEVLNAPTKDFGRGLTNHYIDLAKLRPMEELYKRVSK
jgi:hypothetical protein